MAKKTTRKAAKKAAKKATKKIAKRTKKRQCNCASPCSDEDNPVESGSFAAPDDPALHGEISAEARRKYEEETGRPMPGLMDGIEVGNPMLQPDGVVRLIDQMLARRIEPTEPQSIMDQCDAMVAMLINAIELTNDSRASFLLRMITGEIDDSGVDSTVMKLDEIILQLAQLRNSIATHAGS